MRSYTNLNDSLSKISSKTLCVLIAFNRAFNMDLKLMNDCMNELASRRISGEIFNFEDEIDKEFKEFKSGENIQDGLFD